MLLNYLVDIAVLSYSSKYRARPVRCLRDSRL